MFTVIFCFINFYFPANEITLDIGQCGGTWSSWDDRDQPSGTGDWELLDYRSDASDICTNPVAAQGRIVGQTDMVTSQMVQLTLNGLICKNADQSTHESCLDYEARFCCAG